MTGHLHSRARGARGLVTTAVWVSVVCCFPYLFFKVVWTVGIPVGVTDASVLDSGEWVAANALMAVLQLAGLALVLTLARPWAARLPAWVVLLPAWVGTGLLFQVVAGVLLGPLAAGGSNAGAGTGGFAPWVFTVVYAGFAGQAAALAVVFGCHVQARWGQLVGQRTDTVLARAARGQWWPQRHLAGLAQAVAAMAVVMVLLFGYWALGGSLGLSSTAPPQAQQASRAAGALLAVAGLLALAGRWGGHTRLWLPAGLTWVGSGALAAFDALMLTLNRLFLALGAAPPAPDWGPSDTAMAIKVVIGVLAAAVGALAIHAAARDDQSQGSSATARPSPQS